jgi:hypothetical protein
VAATTRSLDAGWPSRPWPTANCQDDELRYPSAVRGGAHLIGTIHIADAHGDTARTWDTAEPKAVQEVEEVLREALAAGRLVYRQAGDGKGERVTLES